MWTNSTQENPNPTYHQSSILEANLKANTKKSEPLEQITDNRAQTLGITIRIILEVNLKTTSKQQRNFKTTSTK